jgi:hypothetical protein
MVDKAPAVPCGLKTTGRELWQSTVQEFVFDEHEHGLAAGDVSDG